MTPLSHLLPPLRGLTTLARPYARIASPEMLPWLTLLPSFDLRPTEHHRP
jgi:hypothetical protein